MTQLLIIAIVVGSGVFGARFFPTEEMLQDRFALGQKYYAANDHENSVQVFSQIEKTPNFALLDVDRIEVSIGELRLPIRVAATYQLGNSYRNVGLTKLERSRRAREEGDDATAVLRRSEADTSFNAGKTYYRRLVDDAERAPQNLREMSYYQVVRSSYQMEDYAAVVSEVHDMLRRFPDSAYEVAALYDEGWAHYHTGSYDEAIGTFDHLLEVSDDVLKSDRALFQTGESFFALGRFDAARQRYGALTDKYDFGALSDKELQEMKTQRLRGLVQETTRELVAKAQIRIGDAYAAESNTDLAVAAYSQVPKRYPQEDLLVQKSFDNMAGMAFEQQGVQAGVGVLRQAIEQVSDPVFRGRAQLKIANAFYRDRDYAAAIEEYRVYSRAYGDYATAIGVGLDQVDFLQAEAHREEAAARDAVVNFSKAQELYLRVQTEYPRSQRLAESHYGLGHVHRGLGDLSAASTAFAQVSQSYPDAPVAPYALNWQARLAFGAGDLDGAEGLYLQLIETYPDAGLSDQAWKDLGLIYKNSGKLKEAIAAFGRVGPKSPMWGKVQAEAGDMLLAAGRSAEIDRLFDVSGAIDQAKNRRDQETLAELYYIQGRIARESGDFKAETEAFGLALEHSTNPQLDAFSLFFRGLAYYQLAGRADAAGDTSSGSGYYRDAVGDLDQLLEQEIDAAADLRGVAYRTRGVALTRLGRSAEAVGTYRILIDQAATDQERAEFELMLMELYYDQGQVAETEKVARRLAADDGPTAERAYFVLVSLLLEQERYKEVLPAADAALARYPQSANRATMMSVRGRSLFFLERYEDAIEAFGDFIATFPTHTDMASAYYQLGYAHEILGQYEKAAQSFVRLARLYPDDPLAADALYRGGENFYNTSDFTQGLEVYLRLAEIYPQSDFAAKALYSAAWTYMDMGREDESVAAMRGLVQKYPHSEFARYAQFSVGDYFYSKKDYRQAQAAYSLVVSGYKGSDEASKAEQLLRDLDEDLASLAYDTVFVEFDRGNYASAVKGFDDIIQQYPGSYSALAALANKGVALEHLGDSEAARGTYQEVIAVAATDPDNANLAEFAKLRLENL
jgi:tetratricopeptide (TPR) repeat protein